MENSQQSEDTGTGQMKNKSYDEILVQLGVKKEEVNDYHCFFFFFFFFFFLFFVLVFSSI